MISLALTIAVLVIAFLLQGGHPWLAGLVAVIPVKIIVVSLISIETGGLPRLATVIEGMLLGQVAWAVVLGIVYLNIRGA